MVASAVLLGLLAVATVTDVGWKRIPNWLTYPGMVAALSCSAVATWFAVDIDHGTPTHVRLYGVVPIADSLAGWLVCGFAMVLCFVCFRIGGGDVKLIAMMGAWLGLRSGLEAMLWTFVFGGCMALILLVWRVGAIALVWRGIGYLRLAIRAVGRVPLSAADREPLQTDLFLSPSALLATVLLEFGF